MEYYKFVTNNYFKIYWFSTRHINKWEKEAAKQYIWSHLCFKKCDEHCMDIINRIHVIRLAIKSLPNWGLILQFYTSIHGCGNYRVGQWSWIMSPKIILLKGWPQISGAHTTPGSLSEMQNFCPRPRTTESESVFYQDSPGVLWFALKFAKQWFKKKVHFLPLISKRWTPILRCKYCYELKNFWDLAKFVWIFDS